GGKGVARTKAEGGLVLAIRGPQAYLAVSVRGKEPSILPLYAIQVLQEIHDTFGVRLEAWTGDPAELAGIRGLLRKVLFATEAVGAFRKVIVGQSGAKELDIVGPEDTWHGMRIDVQVHMNSVSAAYKLWAKKIEILLRSQDAWKIKAGLDRGEYSVGIEGQKVRIDPSMVSFVESVPDYVVEEPFEGGVVYLDTRMSNELVAEGYAREIVELVREAR